MKSVRIVPICGSKQRHGLPAGGLFPSGWSGAPEFLEDPGNGEAGTPWIYEVVVDNYEQNCEDFPKFDII